MSSKFHFYLQTARDGLSVEPIFFPVRYERYDGKSFQNSLPWRTPCHAKMIQALFWQVIRDETGYELNDKHPRSRKNRTRSVDCGAHAWGSRVIERQVLFSDWSTTKAAILASSFFPLKCRINEEEEGDKKKTDK